MITISLVAGVVDPLHSGKVKNFHRKASDTVPREALVELRNTWYVWKAPECLVDKSLCIVLFEDFLGVELDDTSFEEKNTRHGPVTQGNLNGISAYIDNLSLPVGNLYVGGRI